MDTTVTYRCSAPMRLNPTILMYLVMESSYACTSNHLTKEELEDPALTIDIATKTVTDKTRVDLGQELNGIRLLTSGVAAKICVHCYNKLVDANILVGSQKDIQKYGRIPEEEQAAAKSSITSTLRNDYIKNHSTTNEYLSNAQASYNSSGNSDIPFTWAGLKKYNADPENVVDTFNLTEENYGLIVNMINIMTHGPEFKRELEKLINQTNVGLLAYLFHTKNISSTKKLLTKSMIVCPTKGHPKYEIVFKSPYLLNDLEINYIQKQLNSLNSQLQGSLKAYINFKKGGI